MAASVTTLAPERLYALHNTVALDGRVAAYPSAVRGHAPVNCYLLRELDGALMLDTGFAAHEAAITAQLEPLLAGGIPLTLCPLRMNEFMSVSNTIPLAKRFPPARCLAMIRDAAYQLDFESITDADIEHSAQVMPVKLMAGNEWMDVGAKAARPIKFFQSALRLIATRWIYDKTNKTLFTSDMFTHSWGASENESWILDESNDDVSIDQVRSFMLGTRYWWVEGAQTEPLRRALGSVFEQCDIETVAPGYGKILRGRATVERHYAMLDEVLRREDRSLVPARYIPRD